MRYRVKIVAETTVTVEADSFEEAIEQAGEIYWQFDPEQCDYEVTKEDEGDD